jgi:hypothetical protein
LTNVASTLGRAFSASHLSELHPRSGLQVL